MKLFAITPDNFRCEDILSRLPMLKDRGVSYLYLRSGLLSDCLERIIPAVNNYSMLPIIPVRLSKGLKDCGFGVHYRSFETDFLSENNLSSGALTTVSCHGYVNALKLLKCSVNYVFVSPVFKPLSEHDSLRPLFPRDELKKIITAFGERIVLLGGLNSERITSLQEDIQHDFSVAGITMFFGN
jgi:thiamine monophosphate synthase